MRIEVIGNRLYINSEEVSKEDISELLKKIGEIEGYTYFINDIGSLYRIYVPKNKRKGLALGDYVQVLLAKL